MKTNRMILAAAEAMTLALAACTQDEWNGNNGNTNGAEGAVVVITPGEKPLAIDNGQLTIDNYDAAPASKSFSTPPPEGGGAQRAGGLPHSKGLKHSKGLPHSRATQAMRKNPSPPCGVLTLSGGRTELLR